MIEEPNDELSIRRHPAWKHALDQFIAGDFKPGDLVPHAWFYEALGLDPPQNETPHAEAKMTELAYTQGMVSLRRTLLEEHQIDLQNERGLGYSWVVPTAQGDLAVSDVVAGLRKVFRDGTRRLSNVDESALTDAERGKVHEQLAFLGSLRVLTREKLSERLQKRKGLSGPKTQAESA